MAVRAAPARSGRALRPEPGPADRRHLSVVPPNYVTARARRRRARLLVVLTGVAIAGALFGVVAFHVVLTQNQLDLQHLRDVESAAAVKQQQLRLQVAELESPERVVDDAQKLGMVPPATVRYLSPDGTAPPAPIPTQTTPTTRTTSPTATLARPAGVKRVPANTPATTTPARTAPAKPSAAKAPAPRPTPPTTTAAPLTR